MMAKADVLLTAADLLQWREDDRKLDEKIRKLQQQRAELRRKLEAAEVFAERLLPEEGPSRGDSELPLHHSEDDPHEDGDSIPTQLVANLTQTGDSLTVKQIRQRLIDMGFGDKVRTRPNYHYATAYRLTKKGKLLRRGNRYQAAPNSSSQEETGAVGAPVHRDGHT
jgi:hypothetical protein